MVWEIIGWVGSAVIVWSMMQKGILRLRIINGVGCALATVCNLALGVWPMVALNAVLLGIQVWATWRLLRGREDEREYTVVEVTGDGALLAHLLGHADLEVARWAPDFREPAPGARSYVVMHGLLAAGVLVVREDVPGHVVVDLDVVSPTYADLSPGVFLYGPGGVLARRGVTRITAPAGAGDSHYARLGFARDDAGWVKELAPA